MLRGIFNTYRKILLVMLKKFDCQWLVNDSKALFSLGNIWIKTGKHTKGLNIQGKALKNWVDQDDQEFPFDNLEEFISVMGKYQRQDECHQLLCHLDQSGKLFKPYLAYSYFQIGDEVKAKQLMQDYVDNETPDNHDKLPFIMYMSWKLQMDNIAELLIFHKDWKDPLISTFDGRFWKAKMCLKWEKYSLAIETIGKLVAKCEDYVKSATFFTQRNAIRLNIMVSILDSCLCQCPEIDIQVPSNMKKIKRKMELLVKKYNSEKRCMR